MKAAPLKLADASGGLNTRDPASALAPNQLAVKENCQTDGNGFFFQRGGQDLLTITPPNPVPFVADGNTMALWHLDEAVGAGAFIDQGPNAENLLAGDENSITRQVPGVFPIGAPFGVKFKTANPQVRNGYLTKALGGGDPFLAAGSEICIDAWVVIPPSFTGRQHTMSIITPPPPKVVVTLVNWSDSGAPLVGWTDANLFHGLKIWRDASTVSPIRDTGDPYVTWDFSLTTYAAAFSLRTAYLPTNRKLHIRATYSHTRRRARIWVNGVLQQTTAVPLGGSIAPLVAATPRLLLGGTDAANHRGAAFTGTLDEVRISSAVPDDDDWPFDKPQAPLMPFLKADGTRQLLVQAAGGLYYEIGDGKLTLISAADPSSGDPFSTETNFDGRQMGDRLYLSNGVNTPLAWDGLRLLAWGEPISPPTVTEDAAVGTATPGDHLVRYRYRYGDYVTGPGPSALVTVTTHNINVDDLVTRHDNCTAIQVEMTKAGGSDEWFLAREVPNNSNVAKLTLTGAYVDNSDPALDEGAIGVPDGSQPTNLHDLAAYAKRTAEENAISIGKPKYLLPAHTRMFITGDLNRPYSVPFSGLGNADCFYPFSVANFNTNAGECIGLGISHDDILVSKGGKSTSCLRGIDPSSWVIAEDVHPKRGAVDHWSFVHRYPGDGGPYVLLSLCEDGVYAYQNGSLDRISDLITPTVKGLATASASRQDWIDTTFEDFENAKTEGGSATQNIDTPSYEQDGLREVPGQIRLVNQLDYIGLWGATGPLVPGKVTAQVHGAAEGEFYFCTDADTSIYRTTDNFVTAAALPGVGLLNGYRGIELSRLLIAGVENLFVFLARIGAEVGQIYRLEDPYGNAGIGPNLTLLSDGSALGWEWSWTLDVPWVAVASKIFSNTNVPQGNANDRQDFYAIGNGGGSQNNFDFTGSKNIFLNHNQYINFVPNAVGVSGLNIDAQTSITSAGLAYGPDIPGQGGQVLKNQKPLYVDGRISLAAGFYGFHDSMSWYSDPQGFNSVWMGLRVDNGVYMKTRSSDGFALHFTRRETSLFRGGTVRPQSFAVDAGATQYLYFVGSGAEDANQNRTSGLWQIDIQTGILTNIEGDVSAITLDAANNIIYLSRYFEDGGVSNYGFNCLIASYDALTGAFITSQDFDKGNYLPLRLSWNAAGNLLTGTGKKFGDATAAISIGDSFTYQGFVADLNLTTAPTYKVTPVPGYAFTADGDSGEIPVEVAYQTDSPCAEHIVIDRISNAAVLTLNQGHTALAAEEATPYVSPDGSTVATGISCQLLFVEQSDVIGGNLWSDRLYWQTSGNGAPRFVQHGVAGEWTVIGDFISETKDLGVPTSFGSFLTVYGAPAVDFFMRNAAALNTLAASEISVTANKKIVGFAPIKQYAQWHTRLTWTYSVSAPTVSPFVDSVDVSYFLGTANVPRVCAEHYDGRTYFFVARAGALANDLVLVLDKRGAWGTFTAWQVEFACMFLGQFVGLQQYGLVALESGDDDLGRQIVVKVRPGTLMADMDAYLEDVAANVKTWHNKEFSSTDGSMLVKPIAGDTEVAVGVWKFAIPTQTVEQMRRVLGVPSGAWAEGWANAFSIQIESDPNGVVNQRAVVQSVDAKIVVVEPERERYVR